MSISCIVSEIEREDIGRKSPFEPTPPLFVVSFGGYPLEIRLDF